MTTSQQQTPHSNDPQRQDTHPRSTLPHHSACLAAAAMVILVILAIHWLT